MPIFFNFPIPSSYIYGEKFDPIDWRTTYDVFLASESYEITSLYEHCIRLLLGFLDLSNACSILELSSTRSIPELYAASLELCIDGAFHVLDCEDFDNVLPSTVVLIVGNPNVNVPNETYVLFALWIRATIDVCRNDMELTYENVSRHFEAYSKFVQYEDVDMNEVVKYKNEYLMQFCAEMNTHQGRRIILDSRKCIDTPPTTGSTVSKYTNEYLEKYCGEMNTQERRIYPLKRGMRFPLKLPSRFYVSYSSGEIVSMRGLTSQACIGFEIKETAYLIELRMASRYKDKVSYRGIKNLALFENGSRLLTWNIEDNNNNSKLGLKVSERMAYTVQGDVPFQEFRFVLEDLVKLCRNKTYNIEIESVSSDLIWPAFKNKFASNSAITIQTSTYQCLTQMKLLPCPVSENC